MSEFADAVSAVSENLSEWSKDPEKMVGAAGMTATNLLWAQRLTKKAQLSTKGHVAVLLTPMVVGGLVSASEAVRARRARQLTTDETPTWHTYNHVGLMLNEQDDSKELSAHLIAPMGYYRMIVNEAFLNATKEEQQAVFNTALDNDLTDRIAMSAFGTAGVVTSLATRHAFVGDRESLSARRAAALVATTSVRQLVLSKATKMAMKKIREKHLRAGATQRG